MSLAVAQRDTSRRHTAEDSARDRLRTRLHTGGPEHEGVPDVAGRAKQHPDYHPAHVNARAATPFNENDGRPPPRKARSMRELNAPAEVPDDTKLARRKTRKEPKDVASQYPQSPLLQETAAVEQKRNKATDPGLEHFGDHTPHTHHIGGSRKRIYCGNNALAHELTSGMAVIGKRSACFRKGVGGGLHAKIPPGGRDEFIQKWTASYRKIVEQPLHYADTPTPAGKIPATLSQCLARGFAVGSIQKAKKEMRNAE